MSGVHLLRVTRGPLAPPRVARIESEVRALSHGPGDELILQLSAPAEQPAPDAEGTDRLLAGIPVRQVRGGLRAEVRAVREAIRAHRPAAIHAHAFDAALLAAWARRGVRPRPRLVYEVHGAVAFESLYRHGRTPAGFARFAAIYALESLALLASDRHLLVSTAIARHYPAGGRPGLAIPRLVTASEAPAPRGSTGAEGSTGADAELPTGASADLRRLHAFTKAARDAGARLAVHAGSAAPWQMPEATTILLRQLERAHGFRVAILTGAESEFRSLAGARGGEDWWIGRLPRHEVMTALPWFDVGTLLREDVVVNRVASPTKLYEYLVSGLAVLTTEPMIRSNPRLATSGVAVAVDLERIRAGGHEGLAGALETAMDARPALERMTEAFTWSGAAAPLRSLYE